MVNKTSSFLALLVLIQTPVAFADLLPITYDQLNSHLNASSGGGACVTRGSYDADVLLLQQTHSCRQQRLIAHSESSIDLSLFNEDTILAAFVDDSGHVLGGSFSWFAQIPELGILDRELLGFGEVIDVLYIDPELTMRSPDIVGTMYAVLALVELDFVHPSLDGLGSLVLWQSFNQVFWPDCMQVGDQLPGFTCHPWSTSVDLGNNWTGTVFHYLDATVLIPAPGTALLFSIGLLGMMLARFKTAAPL